jgi:hypothetical protein
VVSLSIQAYGGIVIQYRLQPLPSKIFPIPISSYHVMLYNTGNRWNATETQWFKYKHLNEPEWLLKLTQAPTFK